MMATRNPLWLAIGLILVLETTALPLEQPANITQHPLVTSNLPSTEPFDSAATKKPHDRDDISLWLKELFDTGILAPGGQDSPKITFTLTEPNIPAEEQDSYPQHIPQSLNPKPPQVNTTSRAFNLSRYEPYEQIVTSIRYYVNNSDPAEQVSGFSVGTSYERRDIVGIRIGNTTNKKPIIFVECGTHSREWTAITTCLYLIDQLVTKQEKHRDLLDKYAFEIVPCTNPDGYVRSRSDRLWRKNRRPQKGASSFCTGVDLNRNFKAGPHCGVGSSTDPCRIDFCGEAPFSEPETAALRDHMTAIAANVDFYISIHTYGLQWSFPYGYTKNLTADNEELTRLAKLAVNAIRNETGTEYRYGSVATILYETTGISVDWAYEELNITKSFLLELAPSTEDGNGGWGFILPEERIIPIGAETLTGLRAMWLS